MSNIKHPPYHMIEAYAKLAGYSLDDLADSLDMHPRTLRRKINGLSDFKESESSRMAHILRQSRDDLFLTSKV